MTIKGVLLAGASLCTLTAGAAFAKSAPNVHVLAAHPGVGHTVVKTSLHPKNAGTVTYTFSVYTAVSQSADHGVKTKLAATYYTFLSNSSLCQQPKKEKVTLSTKKTKYAKLSTSTETYSEGCGAPTTFYGDVYDLTSKKTPKTPDAFVSTLKAKFKNASGPQTGILNLDVSVSIGS